MSQDRLRLTAENQLLAGAWMCNNHAKDARGLNDLTWNNDEAYVGSDQMFPQQVADLDGTADCYIEKDCTLITAYPFSLGCWFKGTKVTGVLLSLTDQDVADIRYALMLDGAGLLGAFSQDAGGGGRAAETAAAKTDGTWHHALGVFVSQTERRLFLDGGAEIVTDTNDCGAFTAALDRVSIGRFGDSTPTHEFTGQLAECRIYKFAVTADEAWRLANWSYPQEEVIWLPDVVQMKPDFTDADLVTHHFGHRCVGGQDAGDLDYDFSVETGGGGGVVGLPEVGIVLDGTNPPFPATTGTDLSAAGTLHCVVGPSAVAGSQVLQQMVWGGDTVFTVELQGTEVRAGYYDGAWQGKASGGTLAAWESHVIDATWDGTNVRLYIDGSEVTGGSNQPQAYGLNNGYWAAVDSAAVPSGHLGGKISDCQVYTRALNPSEIETRAKALLRDLDLRLQVRGGLDVSPYGLAFTPIGGVSLARDRMTFDGTTGYLRAAASNWRASDTTGIIEVWCKLSAVNAANKALWASSDEASSSHHVRFGLDDLERPWLQVNDGTNRTAKGTTVCVVNRWYHLVGIQDGGQAQLWLNGVRETLTTATLVAHWLHTSPTQRDNVTLGVGYDSVGIKAPFPGQASNARYYAPYTAALAAEVVGHGLAFAEGIYY